eukprot:TRINITY_DN45293_c1_g1_i1.p2 TRINITY_DN45293_c1_g1~~TRINITY_DN45293_c1_g1_i1.p2  ORF type:complete len:315 (+),score=63.79 TRINITY_DN45293_c1_g1_i1:64-945(+)
MAPSKLISLSLALAAPGAFAGICQDATKENNPTCFENVNWAKDTGIVQDPTWYDDIPFLSNSSSFADFQYALATGEESHGNGKKWNCSLPCTLTPEAQKHLAAVGAPEGVETFVPTEAPTLAPTEVPTFMPTAPPATTTTTQAPSEGLNWYWWCLIGAGVCCLLPLLGLACSAFLCYESVAWIIGGSGKRSPQKKQKRGVKPTAAARAEPAPLPVAVARPMPTLVTAHPTPLATYHPVTYTPAEAHTYTYSPAPVSTSVAAPQYVQAPMPVAQAPVTQVPQYYQMHTLPTQQY